MVCLDSSVLIDVLKGRKVISDILSAFEESELAFIPAPAIIEIIRGLYLSNNIKNVRENEKESIDSLLSSFQILELNKESAIKAGEIEAELRNKGELIDIEDIMIGAIAFQNNETLLTNNKKHFEKIKGLKIKGY